MTHQIPKVNGQMRIIMECVLIKIFARTESSSVLNIRKNIVDSFLCDQTLLLWSRDKPFLPLGQFSVHRGL